MERTPNQQTATAEVKTILCGCREDQPCQDHNRDGETEMQVLTQVVSEASRIREIEEREISALASLVERKPHALWCDIFCHECDSVEVHKGASRDLAEKVYTNGKWMVYNGHPLCFDCQNR